MEQYCLKYCSIFFVKWLASIVIVIENQYQLTKDHFNDSDQRSFLCKHFGSKLLKSYKSTKTFSRYSNFFKKN